MIELYELYDLLKEKYRMVIHEDLYLLGRQPNKPNDEDHIICEQKKITWNGKNFKVVCLWQSHPDILFSSKEEVLDFLEVLWKAYYNLI